MKRVKGIAIYYTISSFLCFLFLIPLIHENFIASSCILGVSRFFQSKSNSYVVVGYTLLICVDI